LTREDGGRLITKTHDTVEFVTIGAGWTAGIIAQQLTAAGHEVVSIDRGQPRWTTPDFEHNHDTLKYVARLELMHRLEKESWTWRPSPSARALPMRMYGSFHRSEEHPSELQSLMRISYAV